MPNDPLPPATLNIEVKTFRRIATTLEPRRYCAIDAKMDPHEHGVVAFHKTDTKNGGRLICKGSAAIKVKILDGPNGTKYLPLSIAFKKTADLSDHQHEIDGRDVFKNININRANGTISFENTHPVNYKDGSIDAANLHKHKTTHEFYIVIQRSTDGEIGIIDPDIENKEEW